MKKLLAILLAASMLLTFAACGKPAETAQTPSEPAAQTPTEPASEPAAQPATEPATEPAAQPTTEPATEPTTPPVEEKPYVLQVGFGRSDITPTESVPLAGYGNTSRRMSQSISDPLYSSCIAITDEEGVTILIFNNDAIRCNGDVFTPVREAVSAATGVPFEYIQACATHSHSTPDQSNKNEESQVRYNESLKTLLTDAAVAAMADRAPAQISYAETYPENLNFVRHYLLSDGSAGGDNHGDFTSNYILQHASDADNQMQLLKFTREGAKDVIMVNWQTHPHREGGSTKTNVTADICGVMRDYVEAELDCNFLYFSGAGGNVNPSSRIASEVITADYKEQGTALGKYAVEAAANFKPLKAGPIYLLQDTYTAKVNHSTDYLLDIAKDIQAVWTSENNSSKCKEMGKPYDIDSPYEANAIVSRAGMGETGDILQYAFTIGDVGFVTAPYEMFDTSGRQIKDNSPFEATFVLQCSNSSMGYFPSAYAFTYGSYESDTTKYEAGTAEALAQNYVRMLTELYNTENGTSLAVPQTEPKPMIPASTGSHASDTIYYNYTRGQEHKKVFDNFYAVGVASVKGKSVLAISKEVCDAIDSADFLKLTLDDAGLVIGAEPIKDLTALEAGMSVTAADANGITLKAADGTEKTCKLAESFASVLLTESTIGAGDLDIGDVVTCLTNAGGELVYAVITERHPVPFVCPHCGETITWTEWTNTGALPIESGHYKLNVDVKLSSQANIASDADVVIDLHGHSVDSASGKRAIALFNKGCSVTIMDNSIDGTGTLRGHGATDQGSVVWVRYAGSTLNIYGGTIDGSDVNTTMYGAAIYAPSGATVNLYGGTVIGGNVSVTQAKYDAASDSGKQALGKGGCVYINGTLNQYGGKIIGGKANAFTAADGTVVGGIGDTLLIGSTGTFHYEGGEIEGKVTLAQGSTCDYTGETETAP